MPDKAKYFIGTSGWSYEHWIGKFYPRDLAKSDWLKYYAQNFNTVELNMSFYRFPFRNMLQGWRKKLPDGFEMTLKANRLITHQRRFKDVENLVNRFYNLSDLLAEKLGCILFQAPPSFKKDNESIERLREFLRILDRKQINVMEFRHPSWWHADVYSLLHEYGVAFCTVSGLEMSPDVVISSDCAYFRFHGPGAAYASQYTAEELQYWASAIEAAAAKCKKIYCYFNNDMNCFAVQDAKRLREMLET